MYESVKLITNILSPHKHLGLQGLTTLGKNQNDMGGKAKTVCYPPPISNVGSTPRQIRPPPRIIAQKSFLSFHGARKLTLKLNVTRQTTHLA